MSRIGRLPVVIPAGVQVNVDGATVNVKGPKGELTHVFSPVVMIEIDGQSVLVKRNSEAPTVRALHGMTRALIQNMVTGVSRGFAKVLEIDGVGYGQRWMEKPGAVCRLLKPCSCQPAPGISFSGNQNPPNYYQGL